MTACLFEYWVKGNNLVKWFAKVPTADSLTVVK